MNAPDFAMPHTLKRRIYVSLGRYGDILNILPVVKEYADETGLRPFLMVAAEFAGLLEAVPYAEPLVWRGPWQNCLEAAAAARAAHPECEVINCTVCGVGYRFKRECANYQREAWRFALAPSPWGSLPLDLRVTSSTAVTASGPYVVTCFSGVSTPFAGGAAVIASLRAAGHHVVDVSALRLPRFVDLLPILSGAAAIVVSDTSVMHLARACAHIPIVSLVSDQAPRWNRSEWTFQHAARIWYSDAILSPDSVALAVARVLSGTRRRRYVHAYCYAGAVDVETDRRMSVARASWRHEYGGALPGQWIAAPVNASDLTRDSATVYGDPKPVPFYRDVIAHALKTATEPDDVVVISNADVGVTPGFTGWLEDALLRSGAVFTHRWDFDHRLDRPVASEYAVARGKWYPGSDCWAFTRRWWDKHGAEYPDMMMGREAGDLVLRHLVKQGGGVELPAAIWHEKHASFWEHWGNRDSLPGNIQNRLMATEWLRARGLSWNDGAEVRPGS